MARVRGETPSALRLAVDQFRRCDVAQATFKRLLLPHTLLAYDFEQIMETVYCL